MVTISGPPLDELLDFEPNFAEIDIEVFQYIGRNTAPFLTRPSRMCSVPMYSVVETKCFWLASCITCEHGR